MSDDSRRGSKMREDRPLDALFPELTHEPQAQALRLPEGVDVPSVHPSVLYVELEQGREWGLAVWHVTEQTPALLRATLEAALLRELSMPASADATRRLAGIHLACFAPVDPTILRALGFMPMQWEADGWRDRMRAWRQQAATLSLELPEAPLSVWHMEVAPSALGERVFVAEEQLKRDLVAQRWGDHPGTPSHRMIHALGSGLERSIRPTIAGLDALDAALITRQTGALRWLPPLVFQGLCDLAAMTWAQDLGAEVRWALCELTADGSALPPQILVTAHGVSREIPLGLVLLRLCVLPINHPQAQPPLGSWLRTLSSPRAGD